MKGRKRLFIALCVMIVLVFTAFPSNAAASDYTRGTGHRHVDIDINKVGGKGKLRSRTSFPAKLDPRQESWYKKNARVKDQGMTNLCWAFSTTSAAQISYAKELYDKTGTAIQVPELSPVHLGYFFYNRQDDPLNNTPLDLNRIGDGYSEDDWVSIGGACYYTFSHLATRSGPGLESDTPFTIDGKDDYNGPMALDNEFAYKNALNVENTVIYESGDKDKLKSMITEYGAVVVSAFFGNNSIPLSDLLNDYDTTIKAEAFYNPMPTGEFSNNHEVTVVGWDDNYDKNNFSSTNPITGEEGLKPENDGAWIVLNSWGANYHDNGYFYVSYESTDLLSDGLCAYDMEPAYDDYYFEYDGSAGSRIFELAKGESAANIYSAPDGKPVVLDEIGFTEYNDGQTDYDIMIYTSLQSNSDPSSGNLALTQRVSTSTPGYKSFRLDDPVTVDAGKMYSIAIKPVTDKCYMGIEETRDEGFVQFTAFQEENQSFYTDSDIWKDAAIAVEDQDSFCFRIKGIAPKHEWNEPQYQVSDDKTTVKGTVTCKDDESLTIEETVNVNSETVAATCTEVGHINYSSELFNSPLFEVYKWTEEIPVDQNAHDWEFTEFVYDKNESGLTSAKASYTCRNNPIHTTDLDAAFTITSATASCTDPGTIVYKVVIDDRDTKTADGQYHEETYTVDNATLGHDWGEPVYTWAGDNSSVTAKRICKRGCGEEESETAMSTSQVTKEPTYTEKGETTYTASFTNSAFVTQTKTEANIPVKDQPKDDSEKEQPKDDSAKDQSKDDSGKADPGSDPNRKGEDGTAVGKGASAAAAEKAITSASSDEGPAGTKFAKLKAKSVKQTKTSVKLTWSKTSGAVKYVIYGNKCGKSKKMKKLAEVKGSSQNFTKVAGKKVRKGTFYKFMVVALDNNNCVLSTSKVIHVTTKGGKYRNPSGVNVKGTKVSVKKGGKFSLAGSVSGKKTTSHRKIKYESTNTRIAKVNSKGVITGRKKGTCYVYAYAQNGVFKKIKVTVKA